MTITMIDLMPMILALKAFMIAWLIVFFSPIQDLINKLPIKKIKNTYLRNLTTCTNCLAFWIGLIMTLNIFVAIGAAMMAYAFQVFFKPKF